MANDGDFAFASDGALFEKNNTTNFGAFDPMSTQHDASNNILDVDIFQIAMDTDQNSVINSGFDAMQTQGGNMSFDSSSWTWWRYSASARAFAMRADSSSWWRSAARRAA